MTAQALKKYRTYLTDENGKPVMVQLDLRNKRINTAYNKIMQELENEAVFEMIDAVDNDKNNEWSDFFAVAEDILANRSTKANVQC